MKFSSYTCYGRKINSMLLLQNYFKLIRTFVLYATASTENMIFGEICWKRSRTPETPKSGDVELQIAPIDAAAAMISIASGQLGR